MTKLTSFPEGGKITDHVRLHVPSLLLHFLLPQVVAPCVCRVYLKSNRSLPAEVRLGRRGRGGRFGGAQSQVP